MKMLLSLVVMTSFSLNIFGSDPLSEKIAKYKEDMHRELEPYFNSGNEKVKEAASKVLHNIDAYSGVSDLPSFVADIVSGMDELTEIAQTELRNCEFCGATEGLTECGCEVCTVTLPALYCSDSCRSADKTMHDEHTAKFTPTNIAMIKNVFKKS